MNMTSPFRLKKKERRRYRKDAQKGVAWASKHEISGDKPEGAIDGIRSLAQYSAAMAKLKKRKKTS